MEGFTIIESFSSTKQGDPLRGPLFVLAQYRILLETITWASNYVFPSLTNDTHIMGPMNEITCTFDHLLTQLALVGLKVKVSKCKFWSHRNLSKHNIPHGYTLVTYGLCILGVPMGFRDFATHFFNKVLFQNVAHLNDFFS